MSEVFEEAYRNCTDGLAKTVFNSNLDKCEKDALFDLLSDDLRNLFHTHVDAERKWALKFDSACNAVKLLGEVK